MMKSDEIQQQFSKVLVIHVDQIIVVKRLADEKGLSLVWAVWLF